MTYLEPSLIPGVLNTGMSSDAEAGLTSFNLDVHGSNNVAASVRPMVELCTVGSCDSTHWFPRAQAHYRPGFQYFHGWICFALNFFARRHHLPLASACHA